MQEIFTIKQLAERWGCSKATIARHERAGYLHRCANVPGGIHYPLDEILKCESVGNEYSPLSPATHGMLVRKINTLQKENKILLEQNENLLERLGKAKETLS